MTATLEMRMLGRLAAAIDSLERHNLIFAIDRKAVLLNLWIEVMAMVLDLPNGFDREAQGRASEIVGGFMKIWDKEKEKRAKEGT